MDIKISVGLPVYNGAEFLEETLDSIAQQTFEDYEVIISDNASTDATGDIARARAAADPRIRYFRNAENLGIARNFRRTLEEARGTYFKWTAGDDMLLPQFLEACATVLDSEPTVVACSSRMPFVDRELKRLEYDEHRNVFVTSYDEELKWFEFPEGLAAREPSVRFRAVVHDVHGNLTTEFIYGLARRDAVKTAAPFGLYLGAEKVLLGELSLVGRFRRLEGDLMLRRMHPGHLGASMPTKIAKGYNPQWNGRIAFPVAQQLRGHALSVVRSSLSAREKTSCFAALITKTFGARSLNRLLAPARSNYFGIRLRRTP